MTTGDSPTAQEGPAPLPRIRLTWTHFGQPGESSSWEALINDIDRLDNEGYRIFLGCLAFVVCHFGSAAVKTYIDDVNNERIPIVERIRDSTLASPSGQDTCTKAITKISLLRGLLESAGGPVNVYQRNFNRSLTCNENLRMLDPVPVEGTTSMATFGNIDEFSLSHLLVAIDAPNYKDSPRGFKQYVEQWKQEITLAVPIGLSEALSQGVPNKLLYNISHKLVDWFRIEMNRYRLLYVHHPDNPGLVLVCCCAGSCITRCTSMRGDGHIRDCLSVGAWMRSEEGCNLLQYNRIRIRDHQPIDRLDYMISTMVWYHRMQNHIGAIDDVDLTLGQAPLWKVSGPSSPAAGSSLAAEAPSAVIPSCAADASSAAENLDVVDPNSSLVMFNKILAGQQLEDSHLIWERMASSFISVFVGSNRNTAVHGLIDRDLASATKFDNNDDLEQCKEYWRLRQLLDHRDAYRSMRSRMRPET